MLILVVALIVFVGVEGVLLWSLSGSAPARARRGPDPRQHAPRDRLDRRRRGDPRLPHRRHVRQAARDQEPAASDSGARAPGRRRAPLSPPPTSRRRRGPALNIEVNGQQYVWRYQYPGRRKGVFSYEEMVVPVGMTVRLKITSQDVAHSWWIPKLGGKIDALPGYTNKTWFKAPRPARLQRPVRRAVRPQPRQHVRARARRPPPRVPAWYAGRPPTSRPLTQAPSSARALEARPPPAVQRREAPRPHGHHLDPDRPRGRRSRARPQIMRPRHRPETGWTSWVTTTDHKRIGIMYLFTASSSSSSAASRRC